MVNIAEAAINADVARELLLEAENADRDFDGYVLRYSLRRPTGLTSTQWREDTLDLLVADALVRLERAVTLLAGTT